MKNCVFMMTPYDIEKPFVVLTNIIKTGQTHALSEGLFQIQMRISFPFLLAKDVHRLLFIIRTHSY